MEMDDSSAFSYKKEKSSFIAKLIFSHLGLFVIVILYAVGGAYVYLELESASELRRYEEKKQTARNVREAISVCVTSIESIGEKHAHDHPKRMIYLAEALDDLEGYILDSVYNHKYDGDEESWEYDWTFANSLLLTLSIMTTIGYGHIAPKTFEGQIFTILYALIGCPLFLIFLANIGDAMAKGFIYFYSRCCCRAFRSRRYMEEVPAYKTKKSGKVVIDDVVGEEEYMPTSKMFVPIVVNVVILHFYILIGGLLFSYWETWDKGSSFYFTFVTLSTVGYGDLVPGNALLESGTFVSNAKMLTSVLYIVLGMALLSMCITLMQEQIVTKCKYIAQQVGITKDDSIQPAGDNNCLEDGGKLMPPPDAPMPGSSPFRRASVGVSLAVRSQEEILPGSF